MECPRAADRVHRIARIIGGVSLRERLLHERWLRGGVHPIGTRARADADNARHERSARVERRIRRLLAGADEIMEAHARPPEQWSQWNGDHLLDRVN